MPPAGGLEMEMTTLASLPSLTTTDSSIMGVLCWAGQAGTAAMLMAFILGGAPSNLTVPVTSALATPATAANRIPADSSERNFMVFSSG